MGSDKNKLPVISEISTFLFSVIYLKGEVSVVFISMMYIYIETVHVSVIAPNATMVVSGILVGDMHPRAFVILKEGCYVFPLATRNLLYSFLGQVGQPMGKLVLV